MEEVGGNGGPARIAECGKIGSGTINSNVVPSVNLPSPSVKPSVTPSVKKPPHVIRSDYSKPREKPAKVAKKPTVKNDKKPKPVAIVAPTGIIKTFKTTPNPNRNL
ncbi:uncharacterized protein CELE_K02D10.3 [Caenorhabditis elegans]|uniref:Uncharacterized protein K02D10.3 n=1 Tax=Caenorhabditis elegans TaxID=6239 RepID=YMQ3_CAEEL|nr:Uncharacterized protein CELE_K02D10.3 [Caenorhabditis elegans]P34494.1 RecName: Full=Uncharacterized protein K02D10.3 [Caenorhabditis elegans]CCD71828.1 Uncharacterized protein CELE_K02D10.3 [Caenorhabditis elegans]|eukprot:NP_498938.1 Uncharacterized protein CELE_K02D10.3 [Caenorhabditis elegans]